MNFIPYKIIKLTSVKTPNQIKEDLTALVSKPDWKLSVDKLVNNRILEGKISEKNFTIVVGRYGLTLGRTSLLPVMIGKISEQNSSPGSCISIVIRPFKSGIFILTGFYLLCFAGIYFSIQKHLVVVFIVCCIFILVTYISLIAKFNKESRVYIELINKHT